MHSVQYINPPYLSKGDTIAIIAPAGQLLGKSEALDLAVSQLQSWGLKVVVGANILERLTGTSLVMMIKDVKFSKRC